MSQVAPMQRRGTAGTDTAAAMAAKRAFLRRQADALSPGERLRRQEALQADALKLLRSCPAHYERFVRRNLRRRRVPTPAAGGPAHA